MPPNVAGQRPAHTSSTAPAGSRESQTELHPAVLRRRERELVARSQQLGHKMRRDDARRVVLTFASDSIGASDGWDEWLRHRFDPTQAAALRNVSRGGPDAA